MKTVNRMIYRFLYDISLRKKLLLSYLLLLLLPLTALTYYSYEKITRIIYDRTIFSAEQSFNQTHEYLSYKMYRVLKTSDQIAMDSTIKRIMGRNLSDYRIIDQIQDMYDLTRYADSYRDPEDILKVRFYVQNGTIYSQENVNMFSLEDARNTDWYQKLMTSSEKVVGFPSSYTNDSEKNTTDILSLGRKMISESNYKIILGVFRIDISKGMVDTILARANTVRDSYTYLSNQDGLLVASSNGMTAGERDYAVSAVPDSGKNGVSTVKLDTGTVYYLTRMIPGTDWQMITIIPESSIIREVGGLRTEIIMVLLVLSTVAYAFATYLSVSVTRRLSRLVLRMKQIQDGRLDPVNLRRGKDEVGELTENYNFMLKRITTLLEEQYTLGQELKSAELKALQSQINPHFLYNTLDLINWLSLKNRIAEVSSVTSALANFYKSSLNKGSDISTIENELRHISYYVQIQNFRFLNSIRLEVQVDECVLPYMIPKITLQPLVENAIIHGILEKPDKTGTIAIEGSLEHGYIVLVIRDNGLGMPSHRLEQIAMKHDGDKGSQYAIRNINERLRLLYGEAHRLSYESERGEGTCVTLKIPARKHNDAEAG
ncbi:sensor histidine kinase [Paenibacillus sp. V4I7]|uniref:sensor histidine kinase n=1 Tax=Paenibacillus sp. V4I7 TaxID=3042307 RepID=UPI00278ADBBB|nr:sensor histidine kinase [Paenibacillus sp. V4I7]MDQ0900986.1 two-component system sensor histidine kinase YesM [Paenibacillus sp. V4I7]